MKYLKTYEKYQVSNYLYNIGDYVLFLNPDTQTELQGQIVDIIPSSWPYRIFYFEEKLGLFTEYEIIRKLTSEEIEEFEIRKNARKYNI